MATSNQGITPVSFCSNTTGICTVSGANNSTVTAVAVGTCSITESAPGNTNYLSGTATRTFGIGRQMVTFGVVPSTTVGGSGSVTATSDKALTPVTLTSTTLPVCTISGGTVSGLIASACTIQAVQLGNSAYSPASASLSFPINAATQTLSFAAAPWINVGGTATVTATANQASSTVTLTSATSSVCTISGGTVLGVALGTFTINAAAPATSSYSASSASLSFTISPPAAIACNSKMNGTNPMLATVEGLVLTPRDAGLAG